MGLQRGKQKQDYNEFVNIIKLTLWRHETRRIRVLWLCSWAFARGCAGVVIWFRGESMQHDIHVRVPRVPSEYQCKHSLYHCCFLGMFGLHLAKCTISCNWSNINSSLECGTIHWQAMHQFLIPVTLPVVLAITSIPNQQLQSLYNVYMGKTPCVKTDRKQ